MSQNFLYDISSDVYPQKVLAMHTTTLEKVSESPMHHHLKGQVVMPINGYIRSTIAEGIWVVPPMSAIWIPGMVEHSNYIAPGSKVCMLFIEPDSVPELPGHTCTLSVSPLLRELVLHLARQDQNYTDDSATYRVATVLLEELVRMPTEQFDFPIPVEPRLNRIARALLTSPADKRSVAEWAGEVAMSERTLTRLVRLHVGMTFGKWRAQLHIVLALQQLSNGSPVQHVAEMLGYESASAFIHFFKKQLGRSPKQYIRQKEHPLP